MEVLDEFGKSDSEFYKIIESWKLLKEPMKKEKENMTSDIEIVSHDTVMETLERIVAISKDQRICLAHVAKKYNLDISNYIFTQESYNPLEIVKQMYETDRFKELNFSLDAFVEKIDSDKHFEKQEFKI